jgi:hypothetical protein
VRVVDDLGYDWIVTGRLAERSISLDGLSHIVSASSSTFMSTFHSNRALIPTGIRQYQTLSCQLIGEIVTVGNPDSKSGEAGDSWSGSVIAFVDLGWSGFSDNFRWANGVLIFLEEMLESTWSVTYSADTVHTHYALADGYLDIKSAQIYSWCGFINRGTRKLTLVFRPLSKVHPSELQELMIF